MIRNRVSRCFVVPVLVASLAGCARPVSRPDSSAGRPSGPAITLPGQVTPSATAVTCPPEGVRFEVGEGDAAMGLRVLGIKLINCGSETYRLNGYPAVRPLDEDLTKLKVRILHGVTEITGTMPWDGPPKPVTLEPGQQAGTAVAWRNTYDDVRQPPVRVEFLDIAPLAGRPSRIVDPRGGLDLGSTGRFGVSAWRLLPDDETTPSPTDPVSPGATTAEPVETVGPLP
ncbi:DUF4232 domain-containing protein [Actinoplanes utahensis]|uniref:DUF4232 domain-containing protein n=1 Tax=Actinoplanes utahensis TaxID=1869 RepID=UPI00068EAAA5|nr:DUF4232 domain-containing protein [Actinoplanes utahensis]GIF27208.1 hypothetical protein Aut01nite_01940 [Actinoplanes utahensis]